MKADFKIQKKTIESFFNYAQKIVEECEIVITEKGWHIRQMSEDHISLIDVTLNYDSFDEYYNYKEKYEIRIGVNVEDVYKTLRGKELSDPIIINIDESKFYLSDTEKTLFEIPLIEILEKNIKFPELNVTTSFKIRGTALKKIIKNAMKVKVDGISHLDIKTIDRDKIEFKCVGETTEFKTILDQKENYGGDLDINEIIFWEESWGSYRLSYLDPITKAFSNNAEIKIIIGQDVPIMLEILEDNGKMSIKYILAPKVERDNYKKPYVLPAMIFDNLKVMSNVNTIKKFIQNYIGNYHYSYKIPLSVINEFDLIKEFENIKHEESDGYLVIYQ